jgi:hypothetical protein
MTMSFWSPRLDLLGWCRLHEHVDFRQGYLLIEALLLYVYYMQVSSDVSAIDCLLSFACFAENNVLDDSLVGLHCEQVQLPEFEA